ncbi:zinc ABC transporter substrate-binding protein [Synechocystis sp. LKSZ1]|uniref:metal ABC transporter solute-binding protein, Zn/Mn family n=1 Tax=Synechocystis sp. LKSZ1 TaxID=3144951 RepID=UPI00336BBF5A
MLIRHGWMLAIVLVSCLAGAGCQGSRPAPETSRLDITVSIPPQRYFVEKIGGDRVKVNVMVEGARDPHTYEPKPQQLQALSEAEAYVKVGIGLEDAWLNKFKAVNPALKFIDSSTGITPLQTEAHDHSHDDHGTKAALVADPHIWLSPKLAKIQAQNIYQGLAQIDPSQAEQYKANLNQFLKEIDQLDQNIRQTLAPIQQRQFIVFHPAWAYFARDYNLEQIPIEVEGQEPSAQELAAVIKTAQKEGIQVIFAQPQLSPKSAETIAKEINGRVVLIDDLAPNWSENLRQVSATFAQALKTTSR